MIIPKTQIWKACPTESGERPTLDGVHYNSKRQQLEACDGYILAVCPVSQEIEGPQAGGIVPAQVVKDAYRLARAKANSPTVKASVFDTHDKIVKEFTPGSVPAFPDGKTEPKSGTPATPIEGNYPDTEEIYPYGLEGYEHIITLDAEKLYRLAQAICEDDENGTKPLLHVRLFKGPLDASPVAVQTRSDNFGLIMPITDAGDK